jgi:hypothetical protein
MAGLETTYFAIYLVYGYASSFSRPCKNIWRGLKPSSNLSILPPGHKRQGHLPNRVNDRQKYPACGGFRLLWNQFFSIVIFEFCIFLPKRQINFVSGSVSMFGNNNFCLSPVFLCPIIQFLPIDKQDQVCILF